MAEWKRSAVDQSSNPVGLTLWFVTISSGMSELVFYIFRRIHVRLPSACQVADERFTFTPVPQTDLKHFNPESSLGRPWLPGRLSLGGLDCLPDPQSHG